MSNYEIEALQDKLLYHEARCRELRAELNTLRVKCPGCRCRLLPGEDCMCCVSTSINNAIDEESQPSSEGDK